VGIAYLKKIMEICVRFEVSEYHLFSGCRAQRASASGEGSVVSPHTSRTAAMESVSAERKGPKWGSARQRPGEWVSFASALDKNGSPLHTRSALGRPLKTQKPEKIGVLFGRCLDTVAIVSHSANQFLSESETRFRAPCPIIQWLC
jgi:hypothetical protein